MTTDTLSVVNTIIAAANLLLLVTIAFSGGRWMGRIETRIEYLEEQFARKAP